MLDTPPKLALQMKRTPCSRSEAKRANVEPQPHNPSDMVDVVVWDVWVTTQIDSTWTADYRLVVQDGHLVVGELRVFPTPPRNPLSPKEREKGLAEGSNPWPAGEWPGILQGIAATVPQFGLTSTILKGVRLGAHITSGRAVLDAWKQGTAAKNVHGLGDVLKNWGVADTRKPASRETGRPGLPHQEYERVVHAYLRAVADGSPRPVQDAARVLKLDAAIVRDRIYRAGRMKMLPRAGKGRVMGGPLGNTRRPPGNKPPGPRTHERR